jgi:hypothetical protein
MYSIQRPLVSIHCSLASSFECGLCTSTFESRSILAGADFPRPKRAGDKIYNTEPSIASLAVAEYIFTWTNYFNSILRHLCGRS